MNTIQQLKAELGRTLPEARLALDAPVNPRTGVWVLDVEHEGRHVVVEWKSGSAELGVSFVHGDAGIGEIPDACFSAVDEAAARVAELLGMRPRRRSAAG